MRVRTIGGVFGLEGALSPEPRPAPFLKPNQLFLANARSGFALLLDHLSPRQVWMPAFLCDSMMSPVRNRGIHLNYYPLNEQLTASFSDWMESIQPGDLVVLADFFGFVCSPDIVSPLKERGAWILEDASHALLSESAGDLGDFVIYSPRKFAGIPDGGILESKSVSLPQIDLRLPPQEWWTSAYQACLLRGEFDRQSGGDREWLGLHQQAEKNQPVGAFRMSELAHRMTLGLDWSGVARKRIENYRILAERLAEFALFPELDAGTVPFGFSVRVKNRNAVREALFEQEIFPSLLWPTRGVIPDEFTVSHRISEQIMTLHCDQRYNAEDMHRTAEILLKRAEA